MSDEKYTIKIYEYGIAHSSPEGLEYPHRDGMTKDQAETWISEFEGDGGREGAFYIIYRPIGEWKQYRKQDVRLTDEDS